MMLAVRGDFNDFAAQRPRNGRVLTLGVNDDNVIGKEAASWLCLLVAAPVAIAGFFHYNGMSLEQFLWAFIKSEILCAGPRRFDSVNLHEELFSDLEGLQE